MDSVGIIKVFYPNPTDELNRFSNYKAVRADARLNTMQLKRQIMEKYNIADEPEYFDILDVMGKMAILSFRSTEPGQESSQSETFMEVSNRVLGDFEIPLHVQNLYQPSSGYIRRFELRAKTMKRFNSGNAEPGIMMPPEIVSINSKPVSPASVKKLGSDYSPASKKSTSSKNSDKQRKNSIMSNKSSNSQNSRSSKTLPLIKGLVLPFSGQETQLLNHILQEINTTKLYSPQYSACYVVSLCHSALINEDFERYLNLLTSIIEILSSRIESFTSTVTQSLEEPSDVGINPKSTLALMHQQQASDLLNDISFFTAFIIEFATHCSTTLTKYHRKEDQASIDSAHEDLFPLFDHFIRELIFSYVIRSIPILESAITEVLLNNSGTSSFIRVFVNFNKSISNSRMPFKFQKHMMCSLLSNLSLSTFETLLVHNELATSRHGSSIVSKLEKLSKWFEKNTDYKQLITRYTCVGTAIGMILMGTASSTQKSYFTKTEIDLLTKKAALSESVTIRLRNVRRSKLQRAIRDVPNFQSTKSILDMDIFYSKNKVKSKIVGFNDFRGKTPLATISKFEKKPLEKVQLSQRMSINKSQKRLDDMSKTKLYNQKNSDDANSIDLSTYQGGQRSLGDVSEFQGIDQENEIVSPRDAAPYEETSSTTSDSTAKPLVSTKKFRNPLPSHQTRVSYNIKPEESLDYESDESDVTSMVSDLMVSDRANNKDPQMKLITLIRKPNESLGVGLVSGLHTRLAQTGIYVKTLKHNGVAVNAGMSLGDRVAAVNGKSVITLNYDEGINMIRDGGDTLKILVIKGNEEMAKEVLLPPLAFDDSFN